MVVAHHHAGTLDAQLAHIAGPDVLVELVHDLDLPAVAGHADGAHLMYVLHTQMDAARAGGLGQAVVGVVFMVGEIVQPMLDERGGHGLGTDVHEPPLGQLIVFQLQLSPVQGRQNVLCPGHQQPHDGTVLLRGRVNHRPGRVALEQHRLASGEQRAEPVHFRARVVQGRNAQKHIVMGGLVVGGLHAGGLAQRLVLEQDGLGEAGSAGGVVDGRLVLVINEYLGCLAGAVGGGPVVILRPGGADVTHEKQQMVLFQRRYDGLHAADKLRSKKQHIRLRQLQAVFDLVRGIAEVQRHGNGSGLEDAKVDGQPLQAVHQQDGHLLSLADAPA